MTVRAVLVTGGGGYIGTTLVPVLLELGYRVTVLDRFLWGEEKLPSPSPQLRLVKGDIRFVAPSIFDGIDAVVDLAALSNDPVGELDPISTWSINHLGRLRICALAKAAGVRRYILPSSCSIYGFVDREVDETSSVNPLTAYAEANHRAENDVLKLCDASYCVVVIRQATVFGFSPRMRFDLAINGMVRGFLAAGKIPILRDGNQWRPFVHVRDAARAIATMLVAPAGDVAGEVFNVGAGDLNYQVFDLAKRVANGMAVPFEYEWYGDADHRSYRVNFDKIRERLGWEPEYDAERGASEVACAIREQRVDPADPTTITLNVYKQLRASGTLI